MITRIWRGWTTHENAPIYQQLLLTEIFPGIASRGVPGYLGISLARRECGNEVEFITIMWLESLDAVKAFSGESYETAVVPPKARSVLARYDERSAHYNTPVSPPEIDASKE